MRRVPLAILIFVSFYFLFADNVKMRFGDKGDTLTVSVAYVDSGCLFLMKTRTDTDTVSVCISGDSLTIKGDKGIDTLRVLEFDGVVIEGGLRVTGTIEGVLISSTFADSFWAVADTNNILATINWIRDEIGDSTLDWLLNAAFADSFWNNADTNNVLVTAKWVRNEIGDSVFVWLLADDFGDSLAANDDEFLLRDGSITLTDTWDAGAHMVRADTVRGDTHILLGDYIELTDAGTMFKIDYNVTNGGIGLYVDNNVGVETLAAAYTAAATTLNYAGFAKLSTSSTGISVTGDIDLSDDLIIDSGDWIGISETDERISFDAGGQLDVLGADLDMNTAGITGVTTIGMSGALTSTLATGTAPFTIASTTLVTNLNADMVDGVHATDFMLKADFIDSLDLSGFVWSDTTDILVTVNALNDSIEGLTGAPADAQYIVVDYDASLSGERKITAGYGLDFVDGGANSTFTIKVDTSEIATPDAVSDSIEGLGAGVTDHGELDGLADDDHTQYLELDGTDTMGGNLNMGGNSIADINDLDSKSDAGDMYIDQNDQDNDLYIRINDGGVMTNSILVDGATNNMSLSAGLLYLDKVNTRVGVNDATPSYTLDVDGTVRATGVITSTLAGGTAPFTIASATLVTNLNADLLDGQHAADIVAGAGAVMADGTVPLTNTWDAGGHMIQADTLQSDNHLIVSGTANFAEYIYHDGDLDTYFRLQGDHVELFVGGLEIMDWTEGMIDKIYMYADLDMQSNGIVNMDTLSISNGGISADKLHIDDGQGVGIVDGEMLLFDSGGQIDVTNADMDFNSNNIVDLADLNGVRYVEGYTTVDAAIKDGGGAAVAGEIRLEPDTEYATTQTEHIPASNTALFIPRGTELRNTKSAATNKSVISLSSVENVLIYGGGTIDGGGADNANYDQSDHGIKILNSDTVTVRDVRVDSAAGDQINIVGSRDVLIDGVTLRTIQFNSSPLRGRACISVVSGGDYGADQYVRRLKITNSTFSGSCSPGMVVIEPPGATGGNPSGEVYDVEISNCIFEGTDSLYVGLLITGADTTKVRRVLVSNCTFRDFNNGIHIYENGSTCRIENIVIDNCMIYNCNRGIRIGSSRNVTISNCEIYNCKNLTSASLNYGIVIDDSAKAVTIVDNVIYSNEEGGIYCATGEDNHHIEGNVIYDNTGHAIYFNGSSGNEIAYSSFIGNKIYNNTGTTDGIVLDYCDDAFVVGNYLVSNGRYGLYLTNCDRVFSANNYLDGNGTSDRITESSCSLTRYGINQEADSVNIGYNNLGLLDLSGNTITHGGSYFHDKSPAADFYVDQKDQDKDIYIRINDGGAMTNSILIDGSNNNMSLSAGLLYVDKVNTRVGINDATPSYTLDVNGTIRCTGKLTASSVDPSFVSYSPETRRDVIHRWVPEVEASQEVMMFWNTDTQQFEYYHLKKRAFYSMIGKLLEER